MKRVRKKKRPTDSPLDAEEDLLGLKDPELSRVAPEPDWYAAADALHDRLEPWLEAEQPAKPVVFYVAPPYGGREEIIQAWASKYEVNAIEPPQRSATARESSRWLDTWPKRSPWLLPKLERCFVRRADGLYFVRELLARVLSGDMGRGVIGCDSWAWAFLQHVWPARPSFTITAQAFDHRKLKALFSLSLSNAEEKRHVRRADNGAYILPPPEGTKDAEISEIFLHELAAFCRGNVGVAQAYWRKALRTLPEDRVEKSGEATGTIGDKTVWVSPWEKMERPVLPQEAGEHALFVLHALLIHNGLSIDLLSEILPPDRAALTEALLFLAEAGLVERIEGLWRVTAAGYPNVRSILQTNDYIIDMF